MPLLGVGESLDATGDATGELLAGGEASKTYQYLVLEEPRDYLSHHGWDSLHIAKAGDLGYVKLN